MPAINQVESLEDISIQLIKQLLLRNIADVRYSQNKAILQKYIEKNLNFDVCQTFLSKVFDIHIYILDVNKKCSFLDLLGSSAMVSIDLTKCGKLYIEDVFHLYRVFVMSNFKNLRKFGVDCNTRIKNDQKYICEVNTMFYKPLSELRYLRWVTLKGLGEPLMLQTLGATCQYLDVSDSIFVNDASIASLLLKNPEEITTLPDISEYHGVLNSCCSSISFLGISGTDVSMPSIILSLLFLPKLCSYGGFIDQSSVSKVLMHLKANAKLEISNLTELWEDDLSVKQIDMLLKICPSLSSLTTSISSLIALKSLINVSFKSLSLDCDFQNCEYELLDYLSVSGSYITHLILENSCNTRVNLVSLLESTPSLRKIKVPLYIEYEENNNLEKWLYLEKAIIDIDSLLCLEVFLLHCPVLSELQVSFNPQPYSLEISDSINDDFVFHIISKGALTQLEYLSIEDCGIGILGLESIAYNSSKLKYIEKVFYWKNFNPDDLIQLRSKIKNLNWNLKIIRNDKFSDIDS